MRNFLPIPFAPFNGQLISKPFNDGARTALSVLASVAWATYNVAGQPLGGLNSEFNAVVDLNAAGPNTVSQTWIINSIYIDNDAVNFPVSVYFPDTQYAVSCPANTSGWFKVFTISRRAWIVGINIDTVSVQNLATTNVFFTDAISVPYTDPEQATAVDYGLVSPIITFGGTGGGIESISIAASGSGYTGGALNITGGGASVVAQAHGILDSFGRFSAIVIDNPGVGYTGPPLVSPANPQGLFPNWVPGAYTVGQTVVDPSGGYWTCTQNVTSTIQPSQLGSPFWRNDGVVANVPADLFVNPANISPITQGLAITANSNYAPRAIGDQGVNYLDTMQGTGAIRRNMFGTPFASGFIYLTSVSVMALNAGSANWAMADSTGQIVLFDFTSPLVNSMPLLQLSSCSIKIPATLEWVLNVTGVSGTQHTGHGFSYTYSQF